MVGQLSEDDLERLYEASLLQDGRVGDLDGRAEDVHAGIENLARAVPLLVVGAHEVAALATFRVHAVLGDVAERAACARLGDTAVAQARERVLAGLDQRQDYARLAALLASRCAVAERVVWCEQRGRLLLRAAGAACVARCMEPIRLADVAASPVSCCSVRRCCDRPNPLKRHWNTHCWPDG